MQPELRWYDAGPENPFGIRILDCRPCTLNMIATTKDQSIAERFVRLRTSDGKDLVHARIPQSVKVPTALEFPHGGAPLEGIVFKADSMEVKWDIYIYDSLFLFARSWTGDLCYRAVASVGATEVRITEIECAASDVELAPCHVYFLIGTHAMRRVLPHRIPPDVPNDPVTIATMSFSLFGRYGCYATFDDITKIPIR